MENSDSRALYEMKLTSGMGFIYGPEGKKAHAKVIEHGKEKSYRLVVNIVGKVRQGKTSLRRMLVGEDFNEHEESTVGIEHEIVETMGTTPNSQNFWSKIDLYKANVEECDLIVGKHVRDTLNKERRGKKYKAEVQSFFKAMILSYFMLFLYFNMATLDAFVGLPWFALMLIVCFALSGMVLFESLRDGFGMAIGTLCLVLYTDSLLRWKSYNTFAELKIKTCLTWSVLSAFLSYASIHMVMAFSMGISTGMGFCFVLCAMASPWNSDTLPHSPFTEPHLHVFTNSILVGIWTIRHPKLLGGVSLFLAVIAHFIPKTFVFSMISGLGCGFSHAIFIKLGFDTYVKLINPVLKTVAANRKQRRLICYCFGIFPGVFIVSVMGWIRPINWTLHFLSGITFVGFIELCHHLLEGKIEAAPKATINNATKVLNSNSEASLKFVFRDFAGHPLYHSVHHVYMMGHCVYIIAVNIVEAKRNFKYAFSEIVYWLQAIYVHDRFPRVRAFIVGTHRDDTSLSRMDIEKVSEQIMDHLPRQFHNMVVWNKQTDRPMFLVENSLRDVKDPDHCYLRQQLLELAQDSMKPEYPIKFLYFYRVINECREKGILIETSDNISELCAGHECVVDGDGELEDLLMYFHECGEIIYNAYDNNLNQLVVLDPKALVRIMVSLVRAPPRAERQAEHMIAWQTVAELGIATKRLLHHIVRRSTLMGENVSVRALISLLECMDLVCKLDLGVDGLNVMGEKCYLIIPLMKDSLPYPQNYWDDCDTDSIVFVDFGPVIPKFIFSRLVCKCTSESHIDIGTDGRYHLNVSSSKALFTYRSTHSYKLELLDISDSVSPSQQLLKIVIRGNDQNVTMELCRNICQKVCEIVERDFRKCRYKIGVACPFDGPHDYCQYEERHIFSLYENMRAEGQPEFPVRVALPDEKEFWCRGRAFSFRLGQVTVPRLGQMTQHANVRLRNSMWSINILDLPPRLYSDICDDLNLHNDMGRDWRGLAEEFGRTTREVEVLKFRSPRDPCDALLQDWAASAHAPSIESLVEKLQRLGRLDVIRRIEEYIQAQ